MIKVNESWKQIDGKYKCPRCNKKFSKNGISTHIWRAHIKEGQDHKYKGFTGKTHSDSSIWNKGLTKYIDKRIKSASEKFVSGIESKRIIPSFLGKTHTKETKEKISKAIKKAHSEGRCWNIGFNRWKREPSYPELWFSKVIKHNFIDKNYISEYQISKYSIDFAWVHKKIAIEIDGDQHQYEPQKTTYLQKNKYLLDLGWRLFRMTWKKVFHDPKKWISEAKILVDGLL